jgi:transposase
LTDELLGFVVAKVGNGKISVGQIEHFSKAADMLSTRSTPLPALDQEVFAMVVPENHFLRRVSAVIDFERFRPRMVDAYDANMGRPAIDPVLMLKVMFLSFHYGLSDRLIIERLRTDMAFRWFLGLGLRDTLPDHTNGTHFRQRLGEERLEQVFQDIVSLAREHGLVRDRLRLKDATHIFADVAELRPLNLAAQVREHVLRAAEPFFPGWVATHRALAENIAMTTAESPEAERLTARVDHLRDMATQLHERTASWPGLDNTPSHSRLRRLLEVVDKLLAGHAHPKAGDRLASVVDPDARTGMHGDYFVGYLLDIAMDADSEIITAVNVLPGNGAEAADAITLIRQEEAAQGNDVQGMSIDGAGYNGPVLHELTDPKGLNLDVTVPPPKPVARSTFGPERFPLKVLENGRGELTCPQGETTRQRERLKDKHAFRYTFKPSQCRACPLREQCLQKPESKKGRTVIKNDYEADYQKVHEKSSTPEYAETRREHPKIERKLGEVVRRHGNRYARYRGLGKVLCQSLFAAIVTNVKRIVKLLGEKRKAASEPLTVRAELGNP